MSEVEKEDLPIAVLLVHPQDAEIIAEAETYQACKPRPRPEWDGELIGEVWNAKVIRTPRVDPGFPDALPKPNGVRGIMYSLREARANTFKYEPPPRRDPNLLQKIILQARNKLIKMLGGHLPGEYNIPRG